MINKWFSIIGLLIFAVIGLGIYMTTWNSTNQTGFPPMLTSMITTYWPLLLGVGILILLISNFSGGRNRN
jgi:hypothetical protein